MKGKEKQNRNPPAQKNKKHHEHTKKVGTQRKHGMKYTLSGEGEKQHGKESAGGRRRDYEEGEERKREERTKNH